MNCDNTVWERRLAYGHYSVSWGHDILYFGGVTVVEYFQSICISVGFRLRVDTVIIRDLGQVLVIVSNGRWMALSKGQYLIYLR